MPDQNHEEQLEELSEFSELSYDEDTLNEGRPNIASPRELNKLIKIGGSRSKFQVKAANRVFLSQGREL